MTPRLLLSAFALLILTVTGFAQDVIIGRVLDAANRQPLELVNVGVVSRNTGTVTNAAGAFRLPLSPDFQADSVRFSMVGYKSRAYHVRDLRKQAASAQLLVTLPEEQYQLKEVVVRPKEYKQKVLGVKSSSRSIVGGFTSDDLGSEIGVLIPIKHTPTYLKSFSFHIAENKYDSLAFRFNIYDVRNGQPGKNILHENILIYTSLEHGPVTVDLTPYHLIAEDDIVIDIEWVKDLGPKKELYFSGSLANKGFFHRKTSQADWKHISIMGLALNVTVEY